VFKTFAISVLALAAAMPCAVRAAPAPSTAPATALDEDVARRWLGMSTTAPRAEAPLGDAQLRTLLRKAVEEAVGRSPALAQARADWEATQFDVEEAKGRRWPQVQVGLASRSATFGGGSSSAGTSQAGATMGATTMLFDWGRIRKTIDSRSMLERAGELKWLATAESLADEVSANIVEQSKAQVIAALSDESVTRMQALIRMLTDIVAVDRGRASELTQARARMLQAQASRDAARARVRDLKLALQRLTGDVALDAPSQRTWDMPIPSLDDALAGTSAHPSVQQAGAEARSSALNAEAMRAGTLPQLNWVVSKTTQRDALGQTQPWQTGLSVSWPIFEGGSARAAEQAARRRAVSSEERRNQLLQDTQSQVRIAFEDATTLAGRARAYRELTLETERVRTAYFEQWYHLGRRQLLDVLQAENDYSSNLVAQYTSQFDGYASTLKMRTAAGGLIPWLASDLPVEQPSMLRTLQRRELESASR